MTRTTLFFRGDDDFHINVDISPLPSPPGGGPSPAGTLPPDVLAVTGLEPAWLMLGVAVLIVVVGVALVRSRRRRL